MKLIIGGAHQGKKDFVKERYLLKDSDIFVCTEETASLDLSKKVIDKFHLFALNIIRSQGDPLEYVKNNIDLLKDSIIVCDDISCGIVPIDTTDRKWRESLGKALVYLSKHSDEVVRVFCGIAMTLK